MINRNLQPHSFQLLQSLVCLLVSGKSILIMARYQCILYLTQEHKPNIKKIHFKCAICSSQSPQNAPEWDSISQKKILMCRKREVLRALGNGDCGTKAQLHCCPQRMIIHVYSFQIKVKLCPMGRTVGVQSNENPCYLQPVFRRKAGVSSTAEAHSLFKFPLIPTPPRLYFFPKYVFLKK